MTLKNIRRFDRGDLAKPSRMANGWLRVDGFIARSGLLEYQRADGSSWVEYRPEDEAFHSDVLESFTALPLTDDHPPEGYLDAANTSRYQVGTIAGTPSRHEDKVRAQILVTDAATITKMTAGKAELSCGYLCDLEMTPGEIDGKRYDAVQRNVRGNHVALVKAGRAGPEIRVRLDTSNAEVIDSQTLPDPQGIPMTVKLKIADVEYEVSEPTVQAFAQYQKAQGEIVAGVTAELEKQKARADAAEASLEAAPAKIKAEMAARIDLETRARTVLGTDVTFEGKADLEIQRAVAETLGLKMDGKPEAYVVACFDLALTKVSESGADALAAARAATAPVRTDSDPESAYQKFLAASRNAYKTPSLK